MPRQSPTVSPELIPLQLHPRVLAALGKELITNDFVAIIELVKNSYDAMATRVDIRFIRESNGNKIILEIEDNGTGMRMETIRDVWAVVATPHRLINPVNVDATRVRRVSGEKGLGRLSAARLGDYLEVFTRSSDAPCFHIQINWATFALESSLAGCNIQVNECREKKLNSSRGTLIRISDLKSFWDDERLDELHDELSRLISPFDDVEDFRIWLTRPGAEAETVEVKTQEFLSKPPYLIKGSVTKAGTLNARYEYTQNGRNRIEEIHRVIRQEKDKDAEGKTKVKSKVRVDKTRVGASECGPFTFEIRAWDDIAIAELSKRLDLKRKNIKDTIKAYRGISLYRDKILVLPKTDSAKDWLGLDIRRVSWVGHRLSTTQIIGYVAITADDNPNIKDTTDRERLEENAATKDFRDVLTRIIRELEIQRDKDKPDDKEKSERATMNLLDDLDPSGVIKSVDEVVSRDGKAVDVVPLIQDYGAKVQVTIGELEKRFYFYSRLATLGTLAALVVHEVRNHTMSLGLLLKAIARLKNEGNLAYMILEEPYRLADQGVRSLERLADRFAPLAGKAFRKKVRNSVIEDVFNDCVAMRQKDVSAKNVTIEVVSLDKYTVAVDPGELTAIFINLIENSLYWFSFSRERDRIIRLQTREFPNSRVYVKFDDSGPGIPDGEEEMIFWPGVTRKSDGLGMGLTVASEIVNQYGGMMALEKPGDLGGASFGFDLPLVSEGK